MPDIPEPVRESLQFHMVRAMPEALDLALEPSS
jgi:hypothetical protein